MKSYSIKKLYANLKNKGINTSHGNGVLLDSYNYYQVVNAYKPLFITEVKKISDINEDLVQNNNFVEDYISIFSLDRSKSNTLLYHDILKKICKKYTFKPNTIEEMEKLVDEKKYILHIYSKRVCLEDFVLMYKLEHALRNFLLKYVLRIEEDIKTIFSNCLANSGYDSNFLLDINNYDLKDDSSIKSLIKIHKKNQNKHSNPIKRKKNQNIIPPFWILINELSMGELNYSIKSLKHEVSNKISFSITKHFTKLDNPSQKQSEKFLKILSDISHFRNDLAHNNPIFLYNVAEYDLSNFPSISYQKPRVRNFLGLSESQQNSALLSSKISILDGLKTFFGNDNYNMIRPSRFRINLSYIIYVIYKIATIIDDQNDFHDTICKIYTKYNIFNLGEWGETNDFSIYNQNIEKLVERQTRMKEVLKIPVKKLTTSSELKKVVRTLKEEINTTISLFSDIVKTNNIKPIKKESKPFLFTESYYKYTGINKAFFNKINN